jgi:hypothetical protein
MGRRIISEIPGQNTLIEHDCFSFLELVLMNVPLTAVKNNVK